MKLDLKKLSFPKDPESMVEYIRELGVGIRPMDDPFFEEGDKICGVYIRTGIIDIDDEMLCHEVMKTFQCDVPNCKMEFDSLLSYELHYNSYHRYTCSECKKHLLSPHLLDLHVSETHDSFFMALAERKPMYRCFVENCLILSSNAKERRSHCIEVHKFPHDFKFDCSVRKVSPKKQIEKAKKNADEMEIEKDNTKHLHHGPFTFGQRKQAKTFKYTKERKEKPIEMHELMESLPS